MAKRPAFDVFGTTKSGDKTFWTKVGGAWENRDGSINVVLNFLPLDGRIQLRLPKADESAPEGAE